MAQLSPEICSVLDGRAFFHLATVAPDGSPHSVPVWMLRDGDRLAFFTQTGSRKAGHLRADPRVSVSVVDETDPYRNVHFRGRVVETVEGDGGTYVKAVPLANAHVLRYNTVGFPPLVDVRVRRAMNLAIDREGLVKSLWRGRATVPNGFQFAGEFGSNPNRPKFEYNPDKAKAVFAKFVKNGTWVCPTSVLFRNIAGLAPEAERDGPLKYMPPILKVMWKQMAPPRESRRAAPGRLR